MKIRSSKELKESMKNLDNVVNFKNDEVEVHSDMNLVMTAAYDEDIKAEEHLTEISDELDKKAEGITPEDPEAPAPEENIYSEQLKLDEALEDFEIRKDGRSRKQKVRGEDEGDVYLDYSMYDFVSELLSGKDCNTNPAPITPIVWRRDPKDDNFKYMEMKKFMTQGEDSVSYGGANETGTFDLEYEDEEEVTNSTETDGMFKGTGAPQVGYDGESFVVHASFEDLQQAQQGLAHYGIRYGEILPKRNKISHWSHNMRVYVPTNSRGDILTLTEWLTMTDRSVEDVMRPNFVKVYNKKLAKVQNAEDLQLVNDIFNSYVEKSRRDSTVSTTDLFAEMLDELADLPYNEEELLAKWDKEVNVPTYYDIFDKYVDQVEAGEDSKRALRNMLAELRSYKIKFNKDETITEFMDEIQ
jgi:hypothetical protein